MPGDRLATLVRRLRREAAESGECSDADLIARFVTMRDEAAFELLVWRHGAMVLAVCRRILGNTEDAEDAFQATFLVLARKASSVRRGMAVPAWLHRVAVRIARRSASKRRIMVVLNAEPAAPSANDTVEQSELNSILDTEIDRLSEPYRRAFVLCYLEGLSNAEAARVLECPVGTIESRLTAARRKLRERLTHRVQLPAGILALLACNADLEARTVATVTRASVTAADRGLKAAIGIVREPAVKLAEGVLTMTKTRVWVMVILGVALIGLAAGVGWANHLADSPTEPDVGAVQPTATPPTVAPPPKPAEKAVSKADSWPLAKQFNSPSDANLIGVAPDGKSLLFQTSFGVLEISLVSQERGLSINSINGVRAAAVSPDGKYVATAEGPNGVKLRDAKTGRIVEALWPRGELPSNQVAFTPDSSKLIVMCSRFDPNTSRKGGGKGGRTVRTDNVFTRVSVWDVATRKETGQPNQTDAVVREDVPFSAQYLHKLAGNGQFVLKLEGGFEKANTFPETETTPKSRRYTITDAVSGKMKKSIDVVGETLAAIRPDPLSPDGKTLALVDTAQNELRFLDTDTGKERFRIPAFRRQITATAFSPDGRFVAAASGRSSPSPGFNSDRSDIAAPSEVVIWNVKTGQEIVRLTDKETIRHYSALAFSPDGSFLAAEIGSPSKSIVIWGHLPASEPEPTKPAVKPVKPGVKKELGGGETTNRFQSLFRDLSGEDVTDARRIEALFLAALGRFPTDVEARTLAAQLARRSDKSAALQEILSTLAQTAEFKAHAEELRQLAK